MIFQHTLSKVLDGTKTMTRRPAVAERAPAWAVGKTYAVQPRRAAKAVGRIQVVGLRKERVGDITSIDAKAEGFSSVEAFATAWKTIHGRFDPSTTVWVIEFKLVAGETMTKARQRDEMNPALARVAEKLRDLWAESDRRDAKARYEIGVLVREAKDAKKYGEKSILRLASALGLDDGTLYRHADVAEAWSAAEFGRLVARKNSRGFPLSWSHFQTIAAAVSSEVERKAFVQRALDDNLTVRDLDALIYMRSQPSAHADDEADDAAGPSKGSVAQGVVAGLGKLTAEAERLLGRDSIWERRVFASLAKAPPTPEVVDALMAARESHQKLKDLCDQRLATIAAGLARSGAKQEAVTVPKPQPKSASPRHRRRTASRAAAARHRRA